MDSKQPQHDELVGIIQKSAELSTHEVSEADLAQINKFALSPLTAAEVFTFKAVLCDNEVDRQYERFNVKALEDLRKLFLGKTVIKNHSRDANDQVARIYATELQQTTKTTKSGELYTQLVAHCYMVRTASNADLIAEIKGGIKREGSVGFSASGALCSICGTDNAKSYCRHWPGKSYDKEGGKEVCIFTLTGARDAYEFSLVAVPAQKSAGVCKCYTGEPQWEKDLPLEEEPTVDTTEEVKHQEAQVRVRLAQARAKTNQN